VHLMLGLVEENTEIEVQIFSGERKSSLYDALSGKQLGTRIYASKQHGSQ